MQDHCSRMKIQAISIAFESANQAPTKPLRRWAPSAPKPLRRQRKALRREPGEPCLPNTWPIASALARRRACLPGPLLARGVGPRTRRDVPCGVTAHPARRS